MDSTTYNYAIIGAGCAGIHLALAMMEDPFFEDKEIIVLEKEAKNKNDRTWCFWEPGEGRWDDMVYHSWGEGKFFSGQEPQQLSMASYRYKMLRSIDFYEHGKSRIKEATNFHWISEAVTDIREEDNAIIGDTNTYNAEHIFDSRIDPSFFQNNDHYTRLLQHFKGWVVETEDDHFDPDEFVMMDFRHRWKNSTSFTYVLPTSKRRALVEFTLFTPELIEDQEYDEMLKSYIREVMGLKDYSVIEVEKGIIPMTDFPFHRHHEEHITKIGTAGGWVRPSSGYSFKNCEKYARKIIRNIKKGDRPEAGVARNRFRMYDRLLLDILNERNELGKELFGSMFGGNPAHRIFKFLDEESSLVEDIKIISGFRSRPFLRALINQLTR